MKPLSGDTLEAIALIESANPDFIDAAMRIFDSGLLPDEFSSSDVADALISIGVPKPTDWRAMGPLMRRAVSYDLIKKTGNFDIKRSITGHTSNHPQPTYELVDPVFRVPAKLRKKSHAQKR